MSIGNSLFPNMGFGQFDQTQLASLQTAAKGISSQSRVPGINQIEMPSWLQSNPDAHLDELLKSYGGIQAAFDPTGQVQARNNAIAYNTSAGGQTANNAATEFSNRAAQSGASQLGAGVVKAQAMMPVLQQNAALKTDAADVAAKAHQEGASLAAQIASTIGNLRTNYLQTLTGFAQGQQQLALSKYQAEQQAAGQAGQQQLSWAGMMADQYKTSEAAKQSSNDQSRLAATALLSASRPQGTYTTNNQGQVTSGRDYYQQLQNYGSSRNRAQQYLGGMF